VWSQFRVVWLLKHAIERQGGTAASCPHSIFPVALWLILHLPHLVLICDVMKSSDLKKANKLCNARDLCTRKTCIIPLTSEQYQRYQIELGSWNRREEAHRKEVLDLFIEKTSSTTDVAQLYLEDSHYHLDRALDRYNLENMTTTEPLDIRQTSRYDSTLLPQVFPVCDR